MPRPGSREARGYGPAHRKLRAEFKRIVDAGMAHCARCGEWIQPGEPFDLDHGEDRTTYLGPSHVRCNRRAGAIKVNAGRRRDLEPRRSRKW